MTWPAATRAVQSGQQSLSHHLTLLNEMPRPRRLLCALLAATTAGCALMVVVNFVVAPLTGHFTGQFEDFGPILSAGRAANAGIDPYTGFLAHAQSSLATALGFCYMPLIAVLARPLADLPHQVAQTIWLWCVLASTITASIVLARTTLPVAWPRTAIGFCVAVLFAPAIYNVWHGQMNALVFLSLVLALRAWLRGDQVGCGLALGLAGVAKVAPAALLLLLLRRRWWRGFLAGTGTLAASLLAGGVFLGFDRIREWLTEILPVLGRADGWYFNESLGALFSRIADHNVFRLDPPDVALQLIVTAASVSCLIAAAWAVRSGDASTERRSLEFGAAVVAMVLAGSLTWWSDYGNLAIPLLILAGLAARGRLARPGIVAGAVLALVVGVASPLFLALGGEAWIEGTLGTPWWPVALQLDSLPAYAAVLLLGTLLVGLARQPADPPSAPPFRLAGAPT
jgi:hypothetical protein